MRSIERRYRNIAEKNPESTSYICFARAIVGQGFCYERIKEWFNKLVDKEDYAQDEKRIILQFLKNL